MKKPIEKNTNTVRPNVSYPDVGGGIDAGDASVTAVRGRAASHSILESFAPLKMRAAEWIRQVGSEIQAIFTRSQLRSAAKNFISQVHIEAEEKSCDLVPYSQKMLDAEIGKHHDKNNIDLFVKIFSKELQSCSSEKILNVIKTLNIQVGANDSLLHFDKHAADFSSAAVEVAAARLAERLFTDCKNNKASMAEEYPEICKKVHINARELFASKMAVKFVKLVEVSSREDINMLKTSPENAEKDRYDAEKKHASDTIKNLKNELKEQEDKLALKIKEKLKVMNECDRGPNKENDPENFKKSAESITSEIESLYKHKQMLQTSLNYEKNVVAEMKSDEWTSYMLSTMHLAVTNKLANQSVEVKHKFYC